MQEKTTTMHSTTVRRARVCALVLAATLAACSRPPRTDGGGATPPTNTTPPQATANNATSPNSASAPPAQTNTGEPTANPTPSTNSAATPTPTPGAPRTTPRPVLTAAQWAALPAAQRFERAVAPFDDQTEIHVRAVYNAGQRAGNARDVFAKIGDSITESGSFASDIGHGWYDLGSYRRLETVIQYFRRHAFSNDRDDNSFAHGSAAATAGWTTSSLLEGGDDCPVEREVRALHPSFAIVMIGTNDAERSSLEVYERELREVIQRVEAHNTVVILSTIPDQKTSESAGRLGLQLNEVVRRLADEKHLPLVDYWGALQGLPNNGLSDDNIHPSVYVERGDTKAATFTDAALRHGYNVRNLTFLLMMERMVNFLALR